MDAIFQAMLDHFGPQNWWPGDTPFEVAVGAILTQNTNWKNVERAIDNLKRHGLLEPHALHTLSVQELAELIRPAGYFRLKAGRLKNFVAWLVARYGGSMEAMAQESLDPLREELLAIKGIGPETADSILLYAAAKHTFVVDAYTHRVAVRHGWMEAEAGYHELKEYFESSLPHDSDRLGEMHAQLVQVGKHYCHKSEPKCSECPLREFLPEGGPIVPD